MLQNRDNRRARTNHRLALIYQLQWSANPQRNVLQLCYCMEGCFPHLHQFTHTRAQLWDIHLNNFFRLEISRKLTSQGFSSYPSMSSALFKTEFSLLISQRSFPQLRGIKTERFPITWQALFMQKHQLPSPTTRYRQNTSFLHSQTKKWPGNTWQTQ